VHAQKAFDCVHATRVLAEVVTAARGANAGARRRSRGRGLARTTRLGRADEKKAAPLPRGRRGTAGEEDLRAETSASTARDKPGGKGRKEEVQGVRNIARMLNLRSEGVGGDGGYWNRRRTAAARDGEPRTCARFVASWGDSLRHEQEEDAAVRLRVAAPLGVAGDEQATTRKWRWCSVLHR
jgi:hypothetical protein